MRWVIVLFSFVLCPLPVAADFQWQASTFVASEHSNNIRLEPEGEGSDTRTDVGVALGFEASHSRYTLNAGYDLRREYFRKDTFDESNTIEGTMSLEALLLPRRLRWFIDHSQENTRIDSRLRDTPDNREERSI
ncbi:MAG: hypothetical protein R3208_07750, partial [Ketobacteraceae bacterium]|nr:hypothetical protein [Ketobacteraceae bacterium]